jgi:hypothetical protein
MVARTPDRGGLYGRPHQSHLTRGLARDRVSGQDAPYSNYSYDKETMMKAVQLIGYGDAVQNLEVRDVPEPPPPGPAEVLVGVEFAPINFNDLLVPWGVFPWKPTPPATIGNEGAGSLRTCLFLAADLR